MSTEAVHEYLIELFSRSLNVDREIMDDDEPFFDQGLTSLIHEEVRAELNARFGELSSTVLFEYPNLRLLTEHLSNSHT